MNYTVCIQAAGVGSRLTLGNGLHKALIPINQKSVLSRIIELYPKNSEFFIIVGYKKEQIKSYLKILYPKYNITYVEVKKFSGPNTGPGYSLLQAKNLIQKPFIFMACDTIVFKRPPLPTANWIGTSKAFESKEYLVAEVDKNHNVLRYYDKMDSHTIRRKSKFYRDEKKPFEAFIGLAGIYNYSQFWHSLESNQHLSKGEIQVTNGLNALILGNLNTMSQSFDWIDTGTDRSYSHARKYFKDKFLLKPDEFLFREKKKIIKFFLDTTKAQKRFKRTDFLNGVNPTTYKEGKNFIWYYYEEGVLLSENKSIDLFASFLNYMYKKLWSKKVVNKKRMSSLCKKASLFYKDKTFSRVKNFLNTNRTLDEIKWINNRLVPSVHDLLNLVPWKDLEQGEFCRFHGDPQPENIIIGKNNKFFLIDWREDFGGDLEFGDLYYDLAKIYHALIVTHKKIREKKFFVSFTDELAFYKFSRRRNLIRCLEYFEKFIVDKGFNLKKVKLLSALIYLNIAPLHHHPYSELLFFHGKLELSKMVTN